MLCLAAAAAVAPGEARSQQRAGITSGEIVLGQAAAYSGTNKELGRQMKIGVETAFLAVNEAGGVHGRMLRLLAADHGNVPPKALEIVKGMVEGKKVFAFVGNTGSAAVEAYLDWLVDQKVILFGSLSGAPFLRNDPPDRYIFNFRASYPEEAAAAVRYLVGVRRIPATEIAYFAQDDAYGEAGWKGMAWQLRRYGIDPSLVIRTSVKRNTVDVAEAVKRIQAAGPRVKAVVCFSTHKPVAKFVEKLGGQGMVFTNASAVEAQDLADDLKGLGPRFMQNMVLTQVVPVPTSRATVVLRYQEQLRRYHPAERPDFLSLQGWLSAQLFIEGLRRAGPEPDTEKLVEALETIRNHDIGIGVAISFGPSEHQGSHKVWGLQLEPSGAWTPIDLE
ncbi:MAG: ABC transporter substrate-binding protein [Deltaproteobacteria bacterium]|nr:ABC transporter substrate-binding protein [Deltaproteobacteria bacterium]